MLEDRVLVWKSKRGDKAAFDALYEKYVDFLLTVAMSLLRDAHEAEEVVQDVFAGFITSLSDFRLKGNLKAFLATCVANRARDRLRRRRRQERCDPPMPRDDIHSPLTLIIHDESVEKMQGALEQLPYEQREIVILKIQGDLSFRALARQQNLALGTVQTRYRSGIARLRCLLNGEVIQ
ncbi:RNA polymerase sigma factor [Planctomycetota bacterium]